jgi:hypothetical protein
MGMRLASLKTIVGAEKLVHSFEIRDQLIGGSPAQADTLLGRNAVGAQKNQSSYQGNYSD